MGKSPDSGDVFDRSERWLNWALVALVALVWAESLWDVRWLPWRPGRMATLQPVLERVEAEVRGEFGAGDRILAIEGRAIQPGMWERAFDRTMPGGIVRVRYRHRAAGQDMTVRDVEVTVPARLRLPSLPGWGWILVGTLVPLFVLAIIFGLFLDGRHSATRARRLAVNGILAGIAIGWASRWTAWPVLPHHRLGFALWLSVITPFLILYAFPVKNRWGRWILWTMVVAWTGLNLAERSVGYLALSEDWATGLELLLKPTQGGLLALMLFKMRPEGPKQEEAPT